MNSGCSYHMIPKKHWFLNYQEINGGKVLLGNDHECRVLGIGDIRLKMHDGSCRTLSSVRHVPELKRNLISLGNLDRNGYNFKGDGGVLRVSRGSLICMRASLQNGIYILQATTLSGEAAMASSMAQIQSKLWHLRMSHISEQGLRELSKQGILGNDQVVGLSLAFCLVRRQCIPQRHY